MHSMQNVVTNKVFELRRNKEITQEHLAKELGATRQTVIAIEKGNYTPSVSLAIRIAKFFNKSVEEVFIIEQ